MRLLPLQRTGVFILLTFASFALPVRATGPHIWGCDLTACKSHPLSNQVLIEQFWLFRSLSSACVHAAFSSTPCESALSSRGSESTKRQ
jgi:hypothetical protein